jgi:membrane protein implicated in regulation of membrane protease activity
MNRLKRATAEVAGWALVALVAGVYSATLAGARPAVAMVIVGACALAAVMLAAYAALRATQRVVRAEGFELVDHRGQVRAAHRWHGRALTRRSSRQLRCLGRLHGGSAADPSQFSGAN